jgi:hypothetical protein
MELHLNTSTLLDPDSLIIPLASPTIPNSIPALIDCGSSDCFIDKSFVNKHNLQYTSIPPLVLHLLDGSSNNIISSFVEMPVSFSSGETFLLCLYITPLDSSCPLVLGYQWLRQYNPLIDWATGHISFRQLGQSEVPAPLGSTPSISSPTPCPTSTPTSTLPVPTPQSSSKPNISLISATAFARACKLPSAQSFKLPLSSLTVTSRLIDDCKGQSNQGACH